MRTITTILAVMLFTGCASMTPSQKKVATIVGSMLVVGAVAAHNADHGTPAVGAVGAPMGCRPQPDGSCR